MNQIYLIICEIIFKWIRFDAFCGIWIGGHYCQWNLIVELQGIFDREEQILKGPTVLNDVTLIRGDAQWFCDNNIEVLYKMCHSNKTLQFFGSILPPSHVAFSGIFNYCVYGNYSVIIFYLGKRYSCQHFWRHYALRRHCRGYHCGCYRPQADHTHRCQVTGMLKMTSLQWDL